MNARMGATVDPFVLLYAVRYALGRQTYAASMAVEALLTNLEVVPAGLRETLGRDIGRALDGTAPMAPEISKVDRPTWERARDAVTVLPEVETIEVTRFEPGRRGNAFDVMVCWADGTTTEGSSTTVGFAVIRAIDAKRGEMGR